MATATFDTLKFAKMLKAVGVPDKQAEGQAEAFSEVIKLNFQEMATKVDLHGVRDFLSRDIVDLRKEIDGRFAELRKEIDGRFEGVARDIADLRKDIRQDLTALDGKFTAQNERTRGEQILVRWMFGLVVSSNIALFVRLVFFPGPH